jgi:hypothetical protein
MYKYRSTTLPHEHRNALLPATTTHPRELYTSEKLPALPVTVVGGDRGDHCGKILKHIMYA